MTLFRKKRVAIEEARVLALLFQTYFNFNLKKRLYPYLGETNRCFLDRLRLVFAWGVKQFCSEQVANVQLKLKGWLEIIIDNSQLAPILNSLQWCIFVGSGGCYGRQLKFSPTERCCVLWPIGAELELKRWKLCHTGDKLLVDK